MIFLWTQANRSFDKRFVFTALSFDFALDRLSEVQLLHLFYSYLIPIHRDLFLLAQYQAITYSAPIGDLLAPPVQRRAYLHLIYNIGLQIYLNQSMVLVSIQGAHLPVTYRRHPSCWRRKHDRDRRLLRPVCLSYCEHIFLYPLNFI